MGIVVISDEALKAELCGDTPDPPEIEWVSSPAEVPAGTEMIVDLLFGNKAERVGSLKKIQAETVVINTVSDTLLETEGSFVRINGWPTFLGGERIECSGNEEKRQATEKFLALFGKKAEWVADEPGFITPRVISMIINEAFFALEENVSSEEDINTAMKLGTNYPYGPFEWAEKIGLDKIHSLLSQLSETNDRYKPASGLTARTQ